MTILVVGFLFLLGAVVGSFLNVCIYRLPRSESIVRPRSFCPACRNRIHALDNIPLVSFLLLKGRCRSCGGRIPFRYPMVELTTAMLFALSVPGPGRGVRFAVFLPFLAISVALFVIDAEHQILPDLLTLNGCAIGLLLSPWNPLARPGDLLLGAVLGATLPTLLRLSYQKIRGRPGMGWGDVKMLAMIGAFLGWQLTLLTIVISSMLGIAWWGLMGILGRGGGLQEALPFGSFLAVGSIACLFFGDPILAWYGSLLMGGMQEPR